MYDSEINLLIQNAVNQHCDDPRMAKVIMDLLHETNKQEYYNRLDWPKHFKKRYRESILNRFEAELKNA